MHFIVSVIRLDEGRPKYGDALVAVSVTLVLAVTSVAVSLISRQPVVWILPTITGTFTAVLWGLRGKHPATRSHQARPPHNEKVVDLSVNSSSAV